MPNPSRAPPRRARLAGSGTWGPVVATLKIALAPPIALKSLVVVNVRMIALPLKVSVMVAPPIVDEAKDTPVTFSPLVVTKLARSMSNEPGPAPAVEPAPKTVI